MTNETNTNGRKSPALGTFGKVYYPLLALLAVVLLVLSFVTYYAVTAPADAGFDTAPAAETAMSLATDTDGWTERNSWTLGSGRADNAVSEIDARLAEIAGSDDAAVLAEATPRAVGGSGTTDKEDSTQDVVADIDFGANATYVWQDLEDLGLTVDNDTIYAMSDNKNNEDYAGQESVVYAGVQPNNLVVIIPGSVTRAAEEAGTATPSDNYAAYGDAVLFMTHYDTASGSAGLGGAAAVGAMLEVIDNVASSGSEYENDLVFVMTDGRYESSVGAYVFMNQFTGFGNVTERIKAAFNFDAVTSDGALTIAGTSDGDSGIMGAYLASGASARTDFSVMGLVEDTTFSDMDAFYSQNRDSWSFPAINFMMTGGSYEETSPAYVSVTDNNTVGETPLITLEEGRKIIENSAAQFAAQMITLADYFGNADISDLGSSTNAAAYTWLGASGIATGPAVYAMSAVLVVLIAAAVALGIKFKGFGIVRTLKGVGGVALVTGLSLAAFAAAYFLLGSLMAAFGVITMNMLTTARFASAALIVPAVVFAAAVSCGLYPLVKRGFKIKAADCVRGGALLIAVIGAAVGFIYPQAALPFVITGIALMAVMIVSTMLRKAFSARFGFGMERLFLYTVPAMFALPFLVQTMLMMSNLVATVSVIFLMLAVTLLLSSITPYFDYMQPVMTDAFARLPKHVVPVIETVTEEVEDVSKKGKFSTVTEQRLVKHKVEWRYHNWFGVLVVTLVSVIALLLSCTLGARSAATFALNRTTTFGYGDSDIRDSIFDNSIVCYIDASSSSVSSFAWKIKDEAVYRDIKYIGSDYDYWNWTWSEELGGEYDKNVSISASNMDFNIFSSPEDDETSDGTDIVYIHPVDASASMVTMTLGNVQTGDTIKIYSGELTEIPSNANELLFSYTFEVAADSIDVTLPFGAGNCTMFVENGTSRTVRVSGYCYSLGNATVSQALSDYYTIVREFEAIYGYAPRFAEVIRDTL